MSFGPQRTRYSAVGLLLGALCLVGCAGVAQQVGQMAALAQCQFRLASVTDTTLAGVRLQGASNLSAAQMLKATATYASGTLPLGFTVQVQAKNPNPSPAGMNRLEWILLIDDEPMTEGVMERTVTIPANDGVGTFDLAMALDLKKTLSGKSLDSMVALARAIAGEGDKPSRVTLKVKPAILVGTYVLRYPGYVTVTHEFPAR